MNAASMLTERGSVTLTNPGVPVSKDAHTCSEASPPVAMPATTSRCCSRRNVSTGCGISWRIARRIASAASVVPARCCTERTPRWYGKLEESTGQRAPRRSDVPVGARRREDLQTRAVGIFEKDTTRMFILTVFGDSVVVESHVVFADLRFRAFHVVDRRHAESEVVQARTRGVETVRALFPER